MTDNGEQHWFIDAWAVLDGYAFASFRASGSIEADVVFFVAPPYFEPEPVASLATALAATRGHFQEGFRDVDGEIAFGSLAQVVETIRRGYRAGGLDPDGTGGLPPVPLPREPAGGGQVVHPAELVDEETERIWKELRPTLLDDSVATERQERLRSLLASLLECVMPRLVPKFVGYSAVSMLVDASGDGPERSARAREACAWIDKVQGFGILVRISQDEPKRVEAGFIGSTQSFEWLTPELDALPKGFSAHPIIYRTSGALVSEVHLPFAVPIVPVFQTGTGKRAYPPIPTLGHLMAAATADRRYMAALEQVIEIVPLLVLALAQLPSAALPHPAFPCLRGTPECRQLCERAATWLARALPSGMLSRHPAEDAVHALVVRLLRGRNDDRGPPARAVTPDFPPGREGSGMGGFSHEVSSTQSGRSRS